MTLMDEIVPKMAETIEARMIEVGILGPSELAARAGVSLPGLAPLRRGVRRKYQARLTAPVCAALRWTPDSIDRLLRGELPVEVSRPAGSDARSVEDRLDALESELHELRGELRRYAEAGAGAAAAVADRESKTRRQRVSR